MFDQTIQTIILGLIQGFSEWLPVSSTAHLRIVEHFWGLRVTGLFNIALHFGTLVVVVFSFRREVKDIFSALAHLDLKSDHGQLISPIIVSTVPTAAIGVAYVRLVEDNVQSLLPIGIAFLIGATFVYASKTGKENVNTVTCVIALIMGIAQGCAIFPGISRSGITISTALLLGLRREKAFTFSFLISIPAIVGNLIVETYKNQGQLGMEGLGSPELLAGIIMAMISGYIAIRLVSRTVTSKKFHYFGLYTWLIGGALIVLVLFGL